MMKIIIPVVALLLIFVGCSYVKAKKRNQVSTMNQLLTDAVPTGKRIIRLTKMSEEEVKLAAALKGCVIVEDGESGLVYRYKCERCGHVQPGSVIMARRIPKGFRLQKHFRCVKCGAQNTAVIQG